MIFVDTSAWVALADSHDGDHAGALEFQRKLARGEFGKQVTSNYVLTESMTMIRRRLGLASALRFSEGFSGGSEVGVFWIEPVHHREAMDLMASHRDKNWSVTDCASFGIMRSLEIQDAFAFDQDFAQAGFVVHP